MLDIILSIVLFPIVVLKFYELIRNKERPDWKTILILVMITFAIIVTFMEKVLKIAVL